VNEGHCGECKYWEEYFRVMYQIGVGTGACVLDGQRVIRTEDDTCGEFAEHSEVRYVPIQEKF
jgi:hypothetical protein